MTLDDNALKQAGELPADPADSLVPVHADESVMSEWPEPTPLKSQVQPGQYPVDVLPTVVKDWALAIAEQLQCPVALPASLALGVLSYGASRCMRVRVLEGWEEPPNLYIAVALRSGESKSPALRAARAPLDSFIQEERDRLRPLLVSLKVERKSLEEKALAKQKLLKREDEKGDQAAQALNEIELELEALPIPSPLRLLASDITEEALGILLAHSHERIGIISDEGGQFANLMGIYRNNKIKLDLFLKGYSGEPYTSDRVTRKAVELDAPLITICMTFQPAIIRGVGERPELRDHGLLSRFLYCLPESRVGYRNPEPTMAPRQVLDGYDRLIRAVFARGRLTDDFVLPPPTILELAPESYRVIVAAKAEIEPRLAPGADLYAYADWMNKAAGRIARIAGILFLAERGAQGGPLGSIPVEFMDRAKTLHDYYLNHAVLAMDLVGSDPDVEDAEYILSWFRAQGRKRATKREIHQGCRGRFQRVGKVTQALDLLIESGWLRDMPQESRPGPGRKGSPLYEVHPSHNAQNAQNAQNPPCVTRAADSVHSVDSVQGGRDTGPSGSRVER